MVEHGHLGSGTGPRIKRRHAGVSSASLPTVHFVTHRLNHQQQERSDATFGAPGLTNGAFLRKTSNNQPRCSALDAALFASPLSRLDEGFSP